LVRVLLHLGSHAGCGLREFHWILRLSAAATTDQCFLRNDVFEAFLPKPRVMIDDQKVDQWPFCITVHPNWCAGKSWADYSDPKLK
jgi:hypothetical protein